ncbi:MAG: TRAP transporter small permease [Rhodospirillales bacterium]|jgi:TRAP-type C4-dicarboxylate transport system permease small subunit|nr:TRAP transporter small permease [Rhodospirillales bacterium]
MRKFEQLIEMPSNLLIGLSCIIMLIMMLHVSADVATKYLFDYQIEGTIEVAANYYMVMIVFFPLAYVARDEGHIIVELFTRKMTEKAVFRLDGVMGIITFIFMLVFMWFTGEEAFTRTLEGEMVQASDDDIVVWPSRWFLPIGTGVMAAYALVRAINDFRQPNG